ncbi:metallopeptidase family protein [Salana multivorans]|uniref:metallopeptidase family protein n=1 Tax=Salana multivorans TaxID=120377 RepID=UPI001FE58BA5|nr:metallopeptidase family protein [Salana multivorans]
MAASRDPERTGGHVHDPHSLDTLALPSRRSGRRRDRRGRGLRGPLLPPGMPAAQSRREEFEDAVLDTVELLERSWAKQLRDVEFGIEEVPPSDPSPWERGVPLGRSFASDAVAGLPARVVLYRRVVEARADGPDDMRSLVRAVVVEQVAEMLGRSPEDIDPTYHAD